MRYFNRGVYSLDRIILCVSQQPPPPLLHTLAGILFPQKSPEFDFSTCQLHILNCQCDSFRQ